MSLVYNSSSAAVNQIIALEELPVGVEGEPMSSLGRRRRGGI